MANTHPTYIVVEGPIGVGKTSLAKRLAATFDSTPLLERPEENPFLERFYQSRKHYALPTQLFFLFQRVRRRGSSYERLIERDYLQGISDAYTQYFHHYMASPLLVVNAAEANFVESDSDFRMLLDLIGRARSGRHFFNPLVAA